MKIIGAGFGRTGTRSLKLALDMLGFGPTLHQQEIIGNEQLTRAWIYKGWGNYIPWEPLLAGYNSAVDWPVASYWKELVDDYPEAKVILTKRPIDEWYRSFSATILPKLCEIQAENHPAHYIIPCVIQRVFRGDLSERNVRKTYHYHAGRVMSRISNPDNLLVLNPSDGWKPLCQFLGVPVPNKPFPKENVRQEFLDRVKKREHA